MLFAESVPNKGSGTFLAFFVCVSVHSQRDGFIGMTKRFAHAGYIRSVCDCKAGKSVTELVGVQIYNKEDNMTELE